MTSSANTLPFSSSKRMFWETLLVLLLCTVPVIFLPAYKGIAVFVPVIYILVERYLRKRTWADLGIRPKQFIKDLWAHLGLVLLVGVVIQAAVIYAAVWLMPEFITHVTARLPFDVAGKLVPILISLFLATFVEEFVYRGLFQQRFAWFMPTITAIVLTSLVFSLLHIAAGIWFVIVVDVLLVFVDSLIYGLIFAKSKNLLVAWAAHFLADVVALFLLMGVVLA